MYLDVLQAVKNACSSLSLRPHHCDMLCIEYELGFTLLLKRTALIKGYWEVEPRLGSRLTRDLRIGAMKTLKNPSPSPGFVVLARLEKPRNAPRHVRAYCGIRQDQLSAEDLLMIPSHALQMSIKVIRELTMREGEEFIKKSRPSAA